MLRRAVLWWLQDITSKRGITRKEIDLLNPGVDLDHLAANQVLSYPLPLYCCRLALEGRTLGIIGRTH